MTKPDARFGLSDKQIASATARALSRVKIPQGASRHPEMSKGERERMEKHVARFQRIFQNAIKPPR